MGLASDAGKGYFRRPYDTKKFQNNIGKIDFSGFRKERGYEVDKSKDEDYEVEDFEPESDTGS